MNSANTVVIEAPFCLNNFIKIKLKLKLTIAAISVACKTTFSCFFTIKIPLQNKFAKTAKINQIDNILTDKPAAI